MSEAVTGARWIQESVPERLDLKHATFGAIQQACDPEAVIGSSTSGFKPSELQQGAALEACISVVGSIILGLLAAWLGVHAGCRLVRKP